MRRLLLCVLILYSFVCAHVEILSGQTQVAGNTVTAQGDVLLVYNDTLMSANKISFDKSTKVLKLTGDVMILQGSTNYILGQDVTIDMKHDANTFAPFFLHAKKEDLWMASSKASTQKNVYALGSSMLSTCNTENPDWRIAFSSGTYYQDIEWLNIFNLRFYAGDIPVFYLPWLGFPTDFTRHTGVLAPKFGSSQLDGWYLELPYFWAINKQSDLELRYQTRTERGNGVFAEYRFVDSPTSEGSIKVGSFRDFAGYTKRLNLKNNTHYGLDVDYDRTHLFDNAIQNSKDTLFLDLNLYNDVDYITLESGGTSDVALQSRTVISRLNYALTTKDNYLGVYGRYYLDTSKTDNSSTLQEIPTVQYHKYTNTFLLKNMLYSLDAKSALRTRGQFANNVENSFEAPAIFTLPLFDEYIYVQTQQRFSVATMNFFNIDDYSALQKAEFESGRTMGLFSTYTLGTDLLKVYQSSIHSVQLSLNYVSALINEREGFYANKFGQYDRQNCQNGQLCEFVREDISDFLDTYNLNFTQYLFSHSGEEIFYHNIRQAVVVDTQGDLNFKTTQNEIRLRLYDDIYFQNLLYYSYEDYRLEKSVTTLSYNNGFSKSSINHYYQNQPHMQEISNYFTIDTRIQAFNNYTINGMYAYDAVQNFSRNWSIGWSMKKRCWSYEVAYSERVRPILSASGASSLTDRYIYVKINLIPLGGFDHRQSILQSVGS